MSDTGKSYPTLVIADAMELQRLADACGQGQAEAMLLLARYIIEKHPKAKEAARMWLLRAAIYGNSDAQRYVMKEVAQDRNFLDHCMLRWGMFLPGRRSNYHEGSYPGAVLNTIGLLAFQPEGSYMLSGINKDRIMVIWEDVDFDPADEDGFGAEEYYDMFCLDEFFQPLPGVPVVRHVTSSDVQYVDICRQKYQTMLSMAALAVKDRNMIPLWSGFVANNQ